MKHIVTLLLLVLFSGVLHAEAPEASQQTLVVAPGAALHLAGGDGTVVVEAALNGGALRRVDGVLRAPSDGEHWLAIAGRDLAGNISRVRWVRLVVDPSKDAAESASPLPNDAKR